jgi:hypothetical protein
MYRRNCLGRGQKKLGKAGNEAGSAEVPGYTLKREYGKTPNGNDLNGKWVLRIGGVFVDFDQYRSDLIERNTLIT